MPYNPGFVGAQSQKGLHAEHHNLLGTALDQIHFNVRDPAYGATASGYLGVSDRLACQAAVNAAGSAGPGARVWFPPGQYAFDAALQVPSYVTLMGPGSNPNSPELSVNAVPAAAELCYLQSGGRNFNLIENDNTSTGNSAINVIGLRFNMGNMAGDAAGVRFSLVDRCSIRDCFFLGPSDTTSQPSNRRAVYVTSSETVNVWGNWGYYLGVEFGGSNACRVEACEFAMGGVSFTSGFGNLARHNQLFSDNVANGTDYAAWRNGIRLNAETDTVAEGNWVTSFRHDGINVDGCNRCLIDGNVSINNSQLTTGTWGGILLEATSVACQYNVVRGNRCYNRQGTPTQQNGIRLFGTGAANANNIITGNQFDGNLGNGFSHGATEGKNFYANNTPQEVPSTASAATVTLPQHADVHTITGTTGITSITASYPGRRITLIFSGALTVTDGSNLKLNGNFVTTADDTLSLVCDGTNWFEGGARSAN